MINWLPVVANDTKLNLPAYAASPAHNASILSTLMDGSISLQLSADLNEDADAQYALPPENWIILS